MPVKIGPYTAAAGGWGSLGGMLKIIATQGTPLATAVMLPKMNKPRGFMCTSCAWSKPANPHLFELCENGAKAAAWETTSGRATPAVFARHTVTELRSWSDHDLERQGRLTHPVRYDAASDRYVSVSWESAYAEIGAELRSIEPKSAVFYTSGRASLEASYLYGLFARLYGHNNLPDSSNMCHETTSVALKKSLGAAVGTVKLEDFDTADLILFFGQNVGTNSPRLLHPLHDASKRGVPIITFNPLKERGLERFADPQKPGELLGSGVRISTQYHAVRAGGDIAALMGLCKRVIELDDATPGVLDRAFLAAHVHGFEAFAAAVRTTSWDAIEAASGLTRTALESAAEVYAQAERVIAVYGMGLTQHRLAVHNVYMLVNLLLLRGNIGREGAGICPVRGHSNVQGQRTVGISEKPDLVPLNRLAAQFGFSPPRDIGLATVDACAGIVSGRVVAFIGLGGNFIRAIPDTERMEAAWKKLRLTVQVATKLNRAHLVGGAVSYVLPCLGRIDVDVQATGPQAVSVEDSTSCIHGSVGVRAGPDVPSEVAIVAGLAKATLAPNPRVDWDGWVADYGKIRDAIAETYPETFSRFNERLFNPGGFYRRNKARERIWETATGRAEMNVPPALSATGFEDVPGRLRLITLRSNDQFNTTIYGYDDRYRGVHGTRSVVFVGPADMARLGLAADAVVTLVGDAGDPVDRRVPGLRVVPYDLPEGCIAAYYPECNALVPLEHYAEESKVPASKSVPVRIMA
jgi:molybdopterin-dependent oxidoreductase alpha subunit